MLLPTLIIPVSIETFETFFEYSFDELYEGTTRLASQKSDILYNGHRYSIYFEDEITIISHQSLIGEIDVIRVNQAKTEIRAAVYRIQESRAGLAFFDNFYNRILFRWEIILDHILYNYKSGNGATEEWLEIGFSSGYFYLPGTLSKLSESENDRYQEWLKYAESERETYSHLSESERESIMQIYLSKINQCLPKVTDLKEVISDKPLAGNRNDFAQNNSVDMPDGILQLTNEPWEKINEGETLKKMVRLIHEGLSPSKIADELGYETSTIYNRTSELRKKYGKETVPYFQEWRNLDN